MKLALIKNGNDTIIKLEGESKFYVLNHGEVSEAARLQLESSARTVKIDLKGIQYIDSSAFNTILKLHRYAVELNKKLVMLNVSSSAMVLFNILKLREILFFEYNEGNTISSPKAAII